MKVSKEFTQNRRRFRLSSQSDLLLSSSHKTYHQHQYCMITKLRGNKIKMNGKFLSATPHGKCPNTEFFLVRIFLYLNWIFNPYSVRIQQNTGQKIVRVWVRFTQCHYKFFIFFHVIILCIVIRNGKTFSFLMTKHFKPIYMILIMEIEIIVIRSAFHESLLQSNRS